MHGEYDLLVIGGGINGTGIARDAAGRGYKVLLCEQYDLASGTSSASSKLIHGGLRYLEQYEFRLVRESLGEREVLWRSAPHVVSPLRFVLPHHVDLRAAPLLRLGLFVYDHLGGRRQLPPTRTLHLREHAAGAPLNARFTLGFEYSDCWVDDARMVVLNALDARERGADVMTRTRFSDAHRQDGIWLADLTLENGDVQRVRARAIVNATGPWVMPVADTLQSRSAGSSVVLVKGSHIVVRKLYEGPQAYTLQGGDGRVVFMIPYEHDFTLIGTTDVPFSADPSGIAISAEETDYLCATVSGYLKREVLPADVVWSYAGVRPLYDDGSHNPSAITRDYTLELSGGGQAPLLTVYGGKITTFRRLAEDALGKLDKLFGRRSRRWTHDAHLPGGDIPEAGFDAWLAGVASRHAFVPPATLRRLACAYGTRIDRVLGLAQRMEDLGRDFGHGLTEAELDYLISNEWACSAEDVLWRRSKLGLHLDAAAQEEVARFVASHRQALASREERHKP
ncbi:MAG: glycerol-3-phosphate dehydrogenase [Rudaea sp.]